MKFETFTGMKDDLSIKHKTRLEKTGNIETEANELLRGNKIGGPTWVRVQNHVQNRVQNRLRKIKKIVNKTCHLHKLQILRRDKL